MKGIIRLFQTCLTYFLVVSLFVPPVGQPQIAVAAEADLVATAGTGQQADKLLNLYFRRIDSFFDQGKMREAKNELNKVYMIDPTNPKAKDYEMRISSAQKDAIKNKEKDLAKREAMLGAHKILQEKNAIKSAFDRMVEARKYDQDEFLDSYFDDTKESHVEFEKLQKMGLEKYRKELLKKAKNYERSNRYKAAVSIYRDLLAIDTNDHESRRRMQEAEMKVKGQMDEFMLGIEEIDDEYMIREVTKKALASADYESAMEGGGFAPSLKEPKPEILPELEDKLKVPVTADFRDVSLVSVINFLADYTGINIITSALVNDDERTVTVRFKNLPLKSALRYILKGQGLSYRIEDDVIWVATVEEMENEEMETRVYYLQKGSGMFTQFSQTTFGNLGTNGGSASVAGTRSIKDLLEESVPFPPGSKIIFDDRLAAIIVTNTPSNLQKIEQILYILDEPPQQILIESRFIEIEVSDNENFGIDMDLDGTLNIPRVGGISSAKDFGFLNSSGWDFTGVSESINSDTGGFNLTFAGLLTHPQYQVFLNALDRSEKTKTLSAPKVTTVNNQTATIKVVTEEVFPTAFEVSLIQQDLNGDGDLDDAGETEFANVPQEFVSRDIGIILEVTPSVGMDHKTITLSIIPEVSAVAATPAKFLRTEFDGNNEVSRGTGTPNLPRFTTSTLSTTVVLDSGETAILGGLITESRGITKEKVPLLGDMPFIGKVFRSEQDTVTRRNLVIFITASVLN